MELSKRAYDYSVRIAELVRYLRESGKGFPLDEELLSCGVDVGMALKNENGREYEKASVALQKADYLIGMAVESGYLTKKESELVLSDTRLLLGRVNQRSV